jgi:hypothetical protein
LLIARHAGHLDCPKHGRLSLGDAFLGVTRMTTQLAAAPDGNLGDFDHAGFSPQSLYRSLSALVNEPWVKGG